MTPEEKQIFDEALKRLEAVEDFMKKMHNNAEIPFDVGEAIKLRVGSLKDVSTKTAASETQSVDEAGVATYDVATPPDGFYITTDGKYIPFYD